jgi:hypothetical protein
MRILIRQAAVHISRTDKKNDRMQFFQGIGIGTGTALLTIFNSSTPRPRSMAVFTVVPSGVALLICQLAPTLGRITYVMPIFSFLETGKFPLIVLPCEQRDSRVQEVGR